MNELTRMAYLDAMGIDNYISRGQLPGAAPSCRLVVLPRQEQRAAVDIDVAGKTATSIAAEPQRGAARMPEVQLANKSSTPAPVQPAADIAQGADMPRFSVAAIVAGDWVWLEELHDMPLAREQVQLVQAMARALQSLTPVAEASTGPATETPIQVTQFDWPMHTNQQLDLSEEAAGAALASFVRRKREQAQCRGVVLLGQACTDRVPGLELDCPWAATSHSTADMLSNSALKRQVWGELKELVAAQ